MNVTERFVNIAALESTPWNNPNMGFEKP